MVTVGLLVACALQAVVDQMADLTARAPFTEDRVAHSWAPWLSWLAPAAGDRGGGGEGDFCRRLASRLNHGGFEPDG
jgi:hypothetical protein